MRFKGLVAPFAESCALGAALMLVATCGGGGGGGPIRTTSSVTITSPTLSPKEGDTLQLIAVARDQLGDVMPGATPEWSVSDLNLAAISAAGLLQTFATGTVVVTATLDGVSGSQSLIISAIELSVTIGDREIVFDHTTDACEPLDLPDQPARFVRAEDGGLVLIDGNAPSHYLSRGADFDSLERVCGEPALVSADRRTAGSYENWEWLWVVYREGTRWHALIHNEFHDAVSDTCLVGDPSPANPCWYNSITYAASSDGGQTFVKPSPPAHVVAPSPKAWVPPLPGDPSPSGWYYAEGYRAPTNIVRAADGYYYSLFESMPDKLQGDYKLCLMRTSSLSDPASWRAWDGSGFNLHMTSPYAAGSPAPLCTGLKTPIAGNHLVYDTWLERYVQVAPAVKWIEGRNVCGFFYALSADLIHWSEYQLLAEAQLPWCAATPEGLEPVRVLYPSIVDHADTTINFERAGRTPYLYYTRFNDCCLDRDLVRVPLTFTRLE